MQIPPSWCCTANIRFLLFSEKQSKARAPIVRLMGGTIISLPYLRFMAE